MGLRKKGNVWYVYFKDTDGRQICRSLKTHEKPMAVQLHAEYMSRLRAAKGARVLARDFAQWMPAEPGGPLMPPAAGHRRGGIRLADMWECAAKKRALGKNHRKIWEKFLERIEVKFADLVTPALALEYLDTFYSGGNGKTYNNVRSILNTIFRCCLIEGGLAASPFAAVMPRRVTEVESHRNLTLAEVDRIMEAGSPLIRMMTMLSRWTTQRLETCAHITPGMLDDERKVIIIQPGKTKRFNEWCCCPIMPDLEKFLESERGTWGKLPPETPLVYAYGYTSNAALSLAFGRLLAKLGITDTAEGKASFHSLRGTGITWFKTHGIKGEDLRAITRHKSDAVEDIYARDIETVSRIAKGAV